MDVKSVVSGGGVRPLSGRIFLRLLTPRVSSVLELPAHFGGSDAEVVAAPEDSVLRVGDTVLVDRYFIVFLVDEPHDAGAIVYCFEHDILCWTAGDSLVPFPSWCLCLPSVEVHTVWREARVGDVERLEVIKDGRQPETYGPGLVHQAATSSDADNVPFDRPADRKPRYILAACASGYNIIYMSKQWRLVAYEDILAELDLS